LAVADTDRIANATGAGAVPEPGGVQCASDLEEPCFSGDECFKSKLKCDGGVPDCRDGSDESALVCDGTFPTAAAGSDNGGGGDDVGGDDVGGGNDPGGGGDTAASTWAIVGAIVGVGVLAIAAYFVSRALHTANDNGSVGSFGFANPNTTHGIASTDGELYTDSGSHRAGGTNEDVYNFMQTWVPRARQPALPATLSPLHVTRSSADVGRSHAGHVCCGSTAGLLFLPSLPTFCLPRSASADLPGFVCPVCCRTKMCYGHMCVRRRRAN